MTLLKKVNLIIANKTDVVPDSIYSNKKSTVHIMFDNFSDYYKVSDIMKNSKTALAGCEISGTFVDNIDLIIREV